MQQPISQEQTLDSFVAPDMVPSIFPASLQQNAIPDLSFSLVHVDADQYDSTREAIRYFYPRLVPGGVLIFDDYDWENCPGVKKAINKFFPGIAPTVLAKYQTVIPCGLGGSDVF